MSRTKRRRRGHGSWQSVRGGGNNLSSLSGNSMHSKGLTSTIAEFVPMWRRLTFFFVGRKGKKRNEKGGKNKDPIFFLKKRKQTKN